MKPTEWLKYKLYGNFDFSVIRTDGHVIKTQKHPFLRKMLAPDSPKCGANPAAWIGSYQEHARLVVCSVDDWVLDNHPYLMTEDQHSKIQAKLNDVHTVLTRMMGHPEGYRLTQEDREALDKAEEEVNAARNALVHFRKS